MWFDKGNRCFKYLIKNKLGASLRSRLRDLALSLQQPGSLLSLGLSGNFLMPEAWPKKKKKKSKAGVAGHLPQLCVCGLIIDLMFLLLQESIAVWK